MAIRLNKTVLRNAIHDLGAIDKRLKQVVATYGPPPLWNRKPGFKTLIYIILEQQVSLASAKATFDKLNKMVESCTPRNFLQLADSDLKSIGFSHQKASYGRNLAEAMLCGNLDLSTLNGLDDVQAREKLMAIKGIGPWTADVYLLRSLGRPDIWPNGDLALVSAVQKLYELGSRPSAKELSKISNSWKPWRAVAARILWHFYLNENDKTKP